MFLDVLRMICFSYVQSIILYGIILGGNSSRSKIIFKIQIRIIRFIVGSSSRDFCCELFRNLEILPFKSRNIFSLSLFVV